MSGNDSVDHPSHYVDAPFECFDLTRLYPFAGGNAIECVFRHRAKNGVEDLEKSLWYVKHASLIELSPSADWLDMTDFGYRCALKALTDEHPGPIALFEAGYISGGMKAVPSGTYEACRLVRILQRADWQGMHGFWKGMWEIAQGYESGRTRTRRAIERRISLMESAPTTGELAVMAGGEGTDRDVWRVKARGINL